MGRFFTATAALAAVVLPAIAQKCGGGTLCPEDSPCCSQYGECGTGAYCLGGCDPINSFKLDACVPMPVCQSKSYDFSNGDGVMANTKYLGDASKSDWSSSGEPAPYQDSMLLTLSEGTVGTLLASTHYVWYGKVSARMKTSAGAGVVTAFILMSDTKDEIDFEFVGTDLQTAQTNYYSLGITDYTNGQNISIPGNSMSDYHDYEIDWSPEQLTWSINGKVLRTLKKSDTWDDKTNRYSYPQSPSRVQLSLWPAGLPTNPKGTIDWAGGVISWDSQYMTNGYYYAQFDSINIECYDTPSDVTVNGKSSYVLANSNAEEKDFQITDDPTVLGSFLATGLDMDLGKEEESASSSVSSAATKTANTVPGMSGMGPGNDNHAGDSASTGTQSQAATGTGTGSSVTGFVQNSDGESGASNIQPETVLSGSLFAVVVAIVGLCIL